ncbi:GNAT family N-acetyltransferase [Acetivibrio cellulolyticus]|uniref:GNAT family N-acetyltransferase n=1 Tax=Acetivibrio cellulolyticus TaxID=35830 RepID=UPI0001E2D8BC|nr:GNAT family N-acetyltransferase [Acetivibrio cellulolyticus]
MYNVNVKGEDVYLKNITPVNLEYVLKWYNEDDFKYATGIEGPVTLNQLTVLYNKIQQSQDHFFSGIFIAATGEMIGVLKGQIKFNNGSAAWINTLIIDQAFQSKGYGTKIVNLFIAYTKMKSNIQRVYLAVAECNSRGDKFWSRLGFEKYGRIDECIRLSGEVQNAIIMHRLV